MFTSYFPLLSVSGLRLDMSINDCHIPCSQAQKPQISLRFKFPACAHSVVKPPFGMLRLTFLSGRGVHNEGQKTVVPWTQQWLYGMCSTPLPQWFTVPINVFSVILRSKYSKLIVYQKKKKNHLTPLSFWFVIKTTLVCVCNERYPS